MPASALGAGGWEVVCLRPGSIEGFTRGLGPAGLAAESACAADLEAVSAGGEIGVVSGFAPGLAELVVSAELTASAAGSRPSPGLEQPDAIMMNELSKSAGARPGKLELNMYLSRRRCIMLPVLR
jgi:hypothetical protein